MISFRQLAAGALLGTLFIAPVAACSSSDDSSDTNGQPSQPSGAGVGCTNDSRVVPFATGVQAKSANGRIVAEIMNADPSPPHSGAGDAGWNVWQLKITVDGQKPTEPIVASTYMPDHGHGSPKPPVVTDNNDGTYRVEPVFLFMPGVWQLKFGVDSEAQNPAVFSFCVP